MELSSGTLLEITVICCENLRVTEDPYVVDMPLHARSITFEVQSNRFKGLRPVGVARIALSDFLTPENSMHVLSYRLRDWEGRRNRVIFFAVRVAVPEPVKRMVVSMNSGDEFVEINQSNEVVVGVPVSVEPLHL
ncbi:uncharacterized protein LOC114167678 [Vigna unguiculata]|uniref:Uncharacterized protein n=1 Tax=Vigna unguiculata TaxID=3917 RepID=A0A4D6MQ50_VIGUN|nr:uncharacterized protein LOC114167678 [Vigna unguiculata]QCE02801.1 hypothetical protein DEO72_LG8g816 [Vigna unguiculata]